MEGNVEQYVARVLDALTAVVDPELNLNVVDLGLIYSVDVREANITVALCLTSPSCPLSDWLQAEAERAVRLVVEQEGVNVQVELVNEPPWTPQRMSPRAKAELGW